MVFDFVSGVGCGTFFSLHGAGSCSRVFSADAMRSVAVQATPDVHGFESQICEEYFPACPSYAWTSFETSLRARDHPH